MQNKNERQYKLFEPKQKESKEDIDDEKIFPKANQEGGFGPTKSRDKIRSFDDWLKYYNTNLNSEIMEEIERSDQDMKEAIEKVFDEDADKDGNNEFQSGPLSINFFMRVSLEYKGPLDTRYLWPKIAYELSKMNREVSKEVFRIAINNLPGLGKKFGIEKSLPVGDRD